MNRTLKDMLSKLVNDQQNDWDMWIPQVLLAYRSTVQSSTGFSPHRLMFGREARVPIDLMVPGSPDEKHPTTSTEFIHNMKRCFQEAYKLTRKNTKISAKRYKEYYDARSSGASYSVGDRVWLHVPYVKRGKNKKLSRPWHGPYVVIKKLTDVVYRIEMEGNKRKRIVVHFNRLKRCFTTPVGQRPPPTKEITQQGEEVKGNDYKNVDIEATDSDEEEWTIVSHHGKDARYRKQEDPTTSGESTTEPNKLTPTTELITQTRGALDMTSGSPMLRVDTHQSSSETTQLQTVEPSHTAREERPRRTRRKPDRLEYHR